MATGKKLIKKMMAKTGLLKPACRAFLRLHSWSYYMADRLSMDLEPDRNHPKQRIIGYKEWFAKRIGAQDVVLDVGSNTGAMVEYMARKAAFVYGIEILAPLYEEARRVRARPNVQFLLGDATKFSYQGLQLINVVTLSNVLEHIEHRPEFLRDLSRQVPWKDPQQQRFLVRVPVIDRDWIVLYKKEQGLEWRWDPTHFTEYTQESFYQEMSEAGLDVLSFERRYGEIFAQCGNQNV